MKYEYVVIGSIDDMTTISEVEALQADLDDVGAKGFRLVSAGKDKCFLIREMDEDEDLRARQDLGSNFILKTVNESLREDLEIHANNLRDVRAENASLKTEVMRLRFLEAAHSDLVSKNAALVKELSLGKKALADERTASDRLRDKIAQVLNND